MFRSIKQTEEKHKKKMMMSVLFQQNKKTHKKYINFTQKKIK